MNATQLNELLSTSVSASFLRMGDGEVRFLLECFSAEWIDEKYDSIERRRDPNEARGTLGLRKRDFHRLCKAYQHATVTDVYDFVPYNAAQLEKLGGKIDIGNAVSSSPSHILINEWTANSLKDFLKKKRVLFCGGESRLLEQLLKAPSYMHASKEYWPHGSEAGVYFCHPHDNGRNPSAQLDNLKSELLSKIRLWNIDAVILSLGGVAKILAAEIALNANIIGIDFGAMMRALVYSGSDGHAFWRSTHNPFLFRIPLDTWMDALEVAQPDLSDMDRIAKAQCQLTLDLQRKQSGRWINSDVHDASSLELSTENLATFQSNYQHYQDRFRTKLRQRQIRPLTRALEDWCYEKKVQGTARIGPMIRRFGRKMIRRISTFQFKSSTNTRKE